jgi:hypothetical protein
LTTTENAPRLTTDCEPAGFPVASRRLQRVAAPNASREGGVKTLLRRGPTALRASRSQTRPAAAALPERMPIGTSMTMSVSFRAARANSGLRSRVSSNTSDDESTSLAAVTQYPCRAPSMPSRRMLACGNSFPVRCRFYAKLPLPLSCHSTATAVGPTPTATTATTPWGGRMAGEGSKPLLCFVRGSQ